LTPAVLDWLERWNIDAEIEDYALRNENSSSPIARRPSFQL
jgi:hypothetical protein